jgi:hypothetical protein
MGEQDCATANPGRSQGGFSAGMTATDHDHIKRVRGKHV